MVPQDHESEFADDVQYLKRQYPVDPDPRRNSLRRPGIDVPPMNGNFRHKESEQQRRDRDDCSDDAEQCDVAKSAGIFSNHDHLGDPRKRPHRIAALWRRIITPAFGDDPAIFELDPDDGIGSIVLTVDGDDGPARTVADAERLQIGAKANPIAGCDGQRDRIVATIDRPQMNVRSGKGAGLPERLAREMIEQPVIAGADH